MSIDIPLSLNPQTLAPFRAAWQSASGVLDGAADAAREALDHIDLARIPDGVRPHIAQVGEIADLLSDPAWQTDDATREGLSRALRYFVDTDDLIPDADPNFGLLDDAIVIELALSVHGREWLAWQEFSAFRRGHPELSGIDRALWASRRREWAQRRRGESSFVAPRFARADDAGRYNQLVALPRIDLH